MHVFSTTAVRSLEVVAWITGFTDSEPRLLVVSVAVVVAAAAMIIALRLLKPRLAKRQARRVVGEFIRHAIVYATVCAIVFGTPGAVNAATYYWDADGSATGNSATNGLGLGGNGIWNTTSPFWWDGTNPNTAWTNPNTAVFTGAGGVVTLGSPIVVDGLTFNTAGVFIGSNAGANTLTLSSGAVITLNHAGIDSISATLAGTNGLNLSSTAGGTLILTGANTYLGTTTIDSGTLQIFSDSALGNASNGITFTGAAGGLSLYGPVVLGATRTITLNNSAAVTLTSATNDPQGILGKVTGAGNLNIVNTGTTYFFNSANDFTGTVWAQNGTLSLYSLSDASGAGNIKLGSVASGATLQWASGAVGPLVLNNRKIELAGTTGGATFDSSSTNAANAMTINSDIVFTTASSGNKTLTFNGVNTGTNNFAGSIFNNGTSTTAITKNGFNMWSLSGTASDYTGLITLTTGVLRINGPGAFGGAGNISFGAINNQVLEIRSDSTPTGLRAVSNNSSTNQFIYVDRALGSTVTDQTITFGTIAQVNNGAGITFVGNHGFGVSLGQNTLATTAATAFTITNNLGSPGLNGYTVGPNEMITIAGFTHSTSNTVGSTQTINGWGNYVINGAITGLGTQALNITKNGLGLLTFAPTSVSAWTSGTLSLAGGITRFVGQPATAGATVTFNGGVGEFRNDTSTVYQTGLTFGTTASTLVIDRTLTPATGSNAMITFGAVTGNNTSTLNIIGDHGYSLTSGTVTVNGTKTLTLANYLATPGYVGYTPGTVTLGNITTDATAGTGTLVLAGYGDFTIGSLTSGAAGTALSLTKSNLGVMTFNTANPGWTSTTQGVLTTTLGTTRIDASVANVIGGTSVGVGGGLTELRNNASTTWANGLVLQTASGTLVVAPQINAPASTLGNTFTFGSFTSATTGLTMTVDTNHQYGLTISGSATSGVAATTLSNVGNGLITLAGGITSPTVASTYTFTGPGDFLVSGNITQSGAGTTAITKSGLGLLTLGGTNVFNGNLVMTGGGVTRITNAAGLGGTTGTITFNGANATAIGVSSLDLRNDGNMDLSQHNFTANVFNVLFNVDRAIGGSGTNKTMMLGGGTLANANGWGFAILGANGYSLQFGSPTNSTTFNVLNGVTYTTSNYIPSVAGNGGVVFNSGISFTNGTASTLALAGTGDYLISGAITNTGATATNTINKSGVGTLTLTGNNSTSFNVASSSILTMAAGITRVSNTNALGGANTTLNLNGAVLDLRSDSALSFGNAAVTVGTVRSTINVDRAVGGSGTGATHVINSVRDNGVFTLFTTGGTQSGVNAYGLTINTFTVAGINTAAIPTIVNSIGNGGVLSIGTLTSAATFNTFINGSGNSNITSALTLATATLTKSGSGTLTISGNAGGANTNGAVTVNGGSLVLDYSTGAATNILQTGSPLTLAQGSLLVKGATTGTTAQTLGNVTPSAGQDNLAVNPNGGAGTTLTFGTLTATTAGSTLLISQPTGATITTTTPMDVVTAQGRNVVLFDGTNYNWTANAGAGTVMASAAYTPLATTGANDTLNSQLIGGAATVMAASRSTNSLMINANAAGGSLNLSTFTLTLNQGGLLFTGDQDYTISSANTTSGLKSAIAVASDTVVNHYGTGVLTISAPILTGTGTTTFTYGGTGKAIIGNSGLLAVGTYAGTTFVNGGILQLASSVGRLGNANTTALTLNGGTLDLNGNAFNVGAFNAGVAGTIDNTSVNPAIFVIGTGTGTGTSTAIIKNTGAALAVTKAGTGAITLGDAITGGSNQFTGDLAFTGASTLTINSLADSAAKINFGVSGATLTYVSRNNLVLDNRTIDISAAGASATISSNSAIGSINGTNAVITINTNLAPTGSGTLGLTLGGGAGNVANGGTGTSVGNGVGGITGSGNVAVINSFNGNISNGTGGGTLGLTISGAGGWALTGNNSYGGGTTISSTGLVRAGSSTAFGGGTVNMTGTATLDLRSDTNLSFANTFQVNSSFTINVDRAVGGSAYGGLMTLAQLNEQTTGRTVTVSNLAGVGSQLGSSNNVVGYGLSIGALNLNVGTATTIANGLGSPGSTTLVVPVSSGIGTPGALTINGINAAASLTNHLLTISSTANTNGTTILNGDITQGAGTALALTYTGNGTLTLANQTNATNYGGGLTINTAGGIVRATNQYSLGTGLISIGNTATLEVRNDANVTYANGITLISTTAAASRLNVGEAINGTGGHNNLVTFGTLTYQGIAGNGLTIGGVGNSNNTSGNSVSFAGVVLNGFSGVVTNNLLMPGVLTLGTITNTAAGTQTLSIGGSGVSIIGDANDGLSGGFTGITYSGTGILDLTRATAANTYTGGLTFTSGTTRIVNAFGLGGSTNTLIFGGGALELRSDTNVTIANPLSLTGNSSLYIGQTAGGTGASTGIMYTFGTLKANVAARTLTVLGIAGSGAASSDSVTIGTVDLNGIAGVTTVSNNLSLPTVVNIGNVTSSVAQASALSFAAGGSGVMTITGNVTDGAATAVGLSYTGSGILDLSRLTSASTYSGGFTLNAGGIARVTGPAAFGASTAGISLLNGTLEVRTDTTFNYLRPVTWNATNSVAINVGELGTGTTTGVGSAINFGQLVVTTAAAKVLTVTGIGGSATSSGDSVSFNGVNFGTGNFSNQITNALGLPGALNLGAITGNAAAAGSATLTIAGTGFTTATDISNGSGGGTAAITYSGTGLFQITPTASATTNYTGGLNLTGAGILRVITNGTATNFGAATNVLALTAGTLDVRADANLVIPNPVTIATNSVTINADQIGSGVLGRTITFNGAATTLNTTAKALIFTSGSNYNLAFTNGFNIQTSGYAITNSASGTVNLGALVYNVATNGTLTLNGSGLTMSTGNISNSAAGTVAVTYSGTGFLDLSGNNASSNGMTALTISGAGGLVRVGAAVNLGIANAPLSISSVGTAATLQVRSDNGGASNGTIAFGNAISFNSIASTLAIIDVGNAGSAVATNNTVAFGLLNNGGATNVGTLTINGSNGYRASFTGLVLPATTGNTTNLIANAPTTIAGNVTNAMSAFAGTNFDTLVLDGVSTGTINGTIADGVGGSITAGGLTRITKQGTGTWILNPGVTGNAYIGVTTVTNGILQAGANNAISSAAGQGLSITASAGSSTNRVTAIVDLAGFNQTLSEGAGGASGTLNTALQMGGANAFSQAILTNSTGTSTLTLAGTTGTNGDVYVPGTNGPLRSIISVTNLNFGAAARTFNVGTTAGDTVGLQVSSAITSGAQSFIKTGTGVLQLTSPTGNIGGLVDIQNGTISTAYGFADTAATSVRLGLTTVATTLQWIGTGGFTWNNRQLVLNGTTAGGTLDSSAANGSGAVTINTAIAFANGTAAKTLTLTGTNTDNNRLATIGNEGAFATIVSKTGVGTWVLGGASTYTGATNITGGTLRLLGTLGNTAVTVNGAGAALNLQGTNPLVAASTLTLTNGKVVFGNGVATPAFQTFTGSGITGTANGSFVGGASNGGSVLNNSILTFNIANGVTETYNGLIGGLGTFENNINLAKTGGGTLVLGGDLTNWTGSSLADPLRPTLSLNAGVLILNGTINTAITNFGGLLIDNSIHGPNFSLVTQGGLVSFDTATDTFASNNLVAASHGVASLNFNNTAIADYAGSDMYIGATGARILQSVSLAPGASNTYRFGGGSPWQAPSTATTSAGGFPGSGGYLQISTLNLVTGSAGVIIGDNLTYNGGAGIFGNLSSVEFLAPQNFSGGLSILGGTFQITTASLSGALIGNPTVPAGSVLFDGGVLNSGFNAILRFGPGTTTDVSAQLGIVSGGTVDTGTNNVTFASALANFAGGTGGLNKIGSGTLVLNKQNTYAGPTGVTQGVLSLDLNAAGGDNVVLGTSAGLILAGGNLTLVGSGGVTARSQTFTTTSFASGSSTINPTLFAAGTGTPNLTLALGTLSRAAGATGNILLVSTNNVTATNTLITQSNILTTNTLITDASGAAYLTFGTTATSVRDWAVTDATTASKIVQAPVAGFYTAATASAISGNADIGALSPTVTLASGNTAITSIRFDNAGARTLTLNQTGASTASIGGILVTSQVGNNATIIAGTATLQGPSSGAGDLVVHNWDTSSSLTISAPIGGAGITKSGPGLLSLTGTNTYAGQTVINGGILQMDTVARYGNTSGFTLNGGTFNWNLVNGVVAKVFTLGVNGGGINAIAAGNASFGTAGDSLLFLGTGSRALNLTSVSDRRADFLFIIGDYGGPTSLNINSLSGVGNQSVVRFSANNTYTGTTTITQGALELNNAGALPGGVGGATLTSANTGGGNLIFNGAGTNHAILGLSTLSGDFTRGLGAGLDQVYFLGNGGFGNMNGATTRIVNIGGAGASLTWGSTFFFPSNGILQFGHSGTNFQAGAIDFQNPLALGATGRTIDVQDNTQSANTSGTDVTLSAALSMASGGSLTKTGLGVMKLVADNSANTAGGSLTVSAGYVLFSNPTNPLLAIPGQGATNRNITLGTNGGVVLAGAAPGAALDLSALINRIASGSGGAVLLDTSAPSATTTIDLSNAAVANVAVGAYSDLGGTPIVFGGTIIPNGTVYRLNSISTAAKGGQGPAATAIPAAGNLLVLPRVNLFSGAVSTVFNSGTYYLPSYNNYTGTTTVNGNANGAAQIGFGNDSAFGSGALLLTGGTAYFGSLNGDHSLSNNVVLTGTGNYVVAGDTTSRGITNRGAFTYLGTITLNASIALFSEGGMDAVFLSDLKPSGATTAITFNSNGGALYSLLTQPAGAVNKTFTSSVINAASDIIVIDSDRSLGAVPASPATNISVVTGAGMLQIQPGTPSVALSVNRNIVQSSNIGVQFNTPGSTISIAGIATGGLVGNSTLTIPGIISGGGTGIISKLGIGTLVLQNANTTTISAGNGLQVFAGTLQLDYANFLGTAGTQQIFNTTPAMLTLGTSVNATLSNGGTLLITNGTLANAQTFTAMTFTSKDNAITLNSTGGVITLGLGAITNSTTGGTLNFTGTGLSAAVINSSFAAVNGILPAATWNGADLVAASGSVLSRYTGYVSLVGSTNITSDTTKNVKLDNTSTGDTQQAAGTTDINTFTFTDTAARNLNIGAGNTLRLGTVGTILAGSGTGGLTIGVSGSAGTISPGGTVANAAGELVFINNSTNPMVLNSTVANNGTGVATVVKSGSGVLRVTAASTYTGATYINAGVLEFSDGSAGKNFGSPTVAAANILMNGGALRYTGTVSNTLLYGTTFNTFGAIDVPNTTAGNSLTMGTTTALSGTTGILGVPGILRKTGAGTLAFSGSVTNANLSVQVVAGTLNLNKTSTATVFAVDNAANAALIIESGASAVITGPNGNQISDTSSVIVKGTGVLDLGGGAATSESIDGLAGDGIVTNLGLTGTFNLTIGASNSANISEYTLAAATAGLSTTGLNNFFGSIQDGGAGKIVALTKAGAGTQIISAAQSYSGSTTISAGTLKFGIANALPSGIGKGDVNLVGNTVIGLITVPGTLDLSGYNQAINGLNSTTGGYVVNTPTLSHNGTAWGTTVAGAFSTVAVSGTNTLIVGNNNASGSFNGILQDGLTIVPVPGTGSSTSVVGFLSFTKVGTGTQVLSGVNTATGLLTVNQGELDLNTAGANAWLGNVIINTTAGTGMLKLLAANQLADASTVTVAGGAFNLNTFNEAIAALSLTSDGVVSGVGSTLTAATNYDLQSGTVSAALAGAVGVNKTTVGTVVLSGANLYTGVTAITEGTLQVDGSIAAASQVNVATAGTLSGSGTVGGNATLTSNGVINFASGATIGGTLGVTGGNWNGLGTVTGAVSSTSGTFSLGSGANLTATAGVGINASTLNGSGTITGNATLSGGGIVNFTSGGLITGNLGVSGGNWNGVGSVTGIVTSSSNTFTIGSAANLTTSGGLSVTGGTLAGTGIVNGNVSYTSSSSSTFAGTIAGAGRTVTVNAPAAMLVLSGTNSYTGATVVSGGTLLAAPGAIATTASVTINSTGKFLGEGIVGGPVTVNSGGTLTAGTDSGNTGASAGEMQIQSMASALSWMGGSTIGFQFSTNDLGTPGIDWSYFNLPNGHLALAADGSNPNSKIKIDITALATNDSTTPGATAAGATRFDPDNQTTPYHWLFVKNFNSIDTSGSTNFTDINDLFTFDASKVYGANSPTAPLSGSFYITTGGNDLYLNYAAVPEPGSITLIGIAGLGLAAYRRRRKRSEAKPEADVCVSQDLQAQVAVPTLRESSCETDSV